VQTSLRVTDRFIAHTHHVVLPTDEYFTDEGYCYGCNDERPGVYADPDCHTCGKGEPPDGMAIILAPRIQPVDWSDDTF
jgi:hypothetical protein